MSPLHHYALAHALNSNLEIAQGGLTRTSRTELPLPTEPVPFEALAGTPRFTYLRTVLPKAPRKSDMEEAILGLASWFAKADDPLPTFREFRDNAVTPGDGMRATVVPTRTLAPADAEPGPSSTLESVLLPASMPFAPGVVLDFEHDAEAVASIWPLTSGHAIDGSARILYTAGTETNPLVQMLGLQPGDTHELGQSTWRVEIGDAVHTATPAGVYATITIHLHAEVTLKIFGMEKTHAYDATFAYAPSLRWWVRREVQEVGKDEIAIDQLVATDESA